MLAYVVPGKILRSNKIKFEVAESELSLLLKNTLAEWNSMGHVVIETHDRVFQTLGQVFQTFDFILRFQKFDQVFGKLGQAFH